MNPLACITGASNGIGLELARLFARNGYDLLITAETNQIHEVAKELRKFNVDIESCQLDLTSFDCVEDFFHKIESMPAPLDSICMTATSFDSELSLIQNNIASLIHLTTLVLPEMYRRNYGNIMFTTSATAMMPGPLYAVYLASKSFVQCYAEAMQAEIEDTGITMIAVPPSDTAEQAYNALMKEKAHIMAGNLKNKLGATHYGG